MRPIRRDCNPRPIVRAVTFRHSQHIRPARHHDRRQLRNRPTGPVHRERRAFHCGRHGERGASRCGAEREWRRAEPGLDRVGVRARNGPACASTPKFGSSALLMIASGLAVARTERYPARRTRWRSSAKPVRPYPWRLISLRREPHVLRHMARMLGSAPMRTLERSGSIHGWLTGLCNQLQARTIRRGRSDSVRTRHRSSNWRFRVHQGSPRARSSALVILSPPPHPASVNCLTNAKSAAVRRRVPPEPEFGAR